MDPKVQSSLRERFEEAKATSISLRSSGIVYRKNQLKKLESWILANRSKIRRAVYDDLQKPHQETELTETFVVLSELRLAKRKLASWAAPKQVASSLTYLGTSASVYYEPKGVCLIIAPWNYPFQLAIAPLISAIASGNTVIVKPSEYAESTSAIIKQMCDELFAPNEVAVITGGIAESQELLKYPFDHIFFTGSPTVGKLVMEAAATNLSSVTLELGGKSPTIVDRTASIKDTARKIAWAKWQNAGQVCIAPDYLIVHEDVKDKLIEELIVQTEKIYGSKETYGGIISRHHHNRINDLMADAIEKGADIEFGGKSDRENLRFTPTVLSNVSRNARVLEEEIFGPILPLVTFTELTEVTAMINEKPKPLALYHFTKSSRNSEYIRKNTSAGMMTINDAVIQFAHPHLPIGGVNTSGIGKSHGHAGFIAFSNEKAVLKQKRGFTMAKMLYPPYSAFKNLMINLMVKYF